MHHSKTESEPDLAWGYSLLNLKYPFFIRGVDEIVGWAIRHREPEDGHSPPHPITFLQIYHLSSILSAYIWNAFTRCS